MPSKKAPTADLYEALTPACRVRKLAALHAVLVHIDAALPLVPYMQAVIRAAADHRAAREALAAFDVTVASEYEQRHGTTAHDWSRPDVTRFTPEQRAQGEGLWHAERAAYTTLTAAEAAYAQAVNDLAADPNNRAAVMDVVEQRGAEADAAFTAAADQLDAVAELIASARIAVGTALGVRTVPLRREWRALRERQGRALAIEREILAPPAPAPEPEPKRRRQVVESNGVAYIGRR